MMRPSVYTIVLGDLAVQTVATRRGSTFVFDLADLPFDPRELLRATVDGLAVIDVETNLDPDGSTVTARTET